MEPITMKDLEQYTDMQRELKELNLRFRTLSRREPYAADVVRGSSAYHPYVERTFLVYGPDAIHAGRLDAMLMRINRQRIGMQRQLERIEDWLETVDDSKVRQLVRLHYIDGITWLSASKRVYGYPCEDAARMRVKRAMEK